VLNIISTVALLLVDKFDSSRIMEIWIIKHMYTLYTYMLLPGYVSDHMNKMVGKDGKQGLDSLRNLQVFCDSTVQ